MVKFTLAMREPRVRFTANADLLLFATICFIAEAGGTQSGLVFNPRPLKLAHSMHARISSLS